MIENLLYSKCNLRSDSCKYFSPLNEENYFKKYEVERKRLETPINVRENILNYSRLAKIFDYPPRKKFSVHLKN
jgi:hypothetical protein